METECQKVGLQLNIKKTKYMAYNTEDEGTCLKAINGDKLVRQADFKYLGSWNDNTCRYISTLVKLCPGKHSTA